MTHYRKLNCENSSRACNDEKDFLARLDDMSEQAFDDQCTGANPRYPLIEEIKKMYLNVYYNKKEKV